MREKKKCIIFGASGKISKLIIKYFIKKIILSLVYPKNLGSIVTMIIHIYLEVTKPVSKKK